MIAGFAVALGAAAAYESAYVLQALEARRAEHDPRLRVSLLGRLLRRPLWLAGTALSGIGAVAQVLALTLAPLTLVQPTLALGLVALLVLARLVLGERTGPREWAGIGAIVIGVAAVAALGPSDAEAGAQAVGTAALLTVLALVLAAPYLVPRADRAPLRVAAVAAGDVIAAIAMKLLADALDDVRWAAAAGWGVLAAGAGILALNAEMGALQRLPATRVAPVVLAAQVLVPVAAAPLVLGEGWADSPAAGAGLAAAILLVALGATLLGSSRAVGDVLRPASLPEQLEHDGGR